MSLRTFTTAVIEKRTNGASSGVFVETLIDSQNGGCQTLRRSLIGRKRQYNLVEN